ncbi:MAG: peptidoglycan editing factor PgeF [Cyanobacteria bacterium J06627_8]
MHSWTWIEHNGRPYLHCQLLEDWRHGFFTRDWWPQPPSSLVDAIAPDTHAYRVKQVHGNTVLTISEWQHHGQPKAEQTPSSTESTQWPEADGIVALQPTEAVWTASADCVPVLIADQVTGHVAAVHAGWRGTAQKIVPVAIQRLLDQGSQLSNLRVALGPAIDGDVYQVSMAVAAEVGATVAVHARKMSGSDDSVADTVQSRSDEAIAHVLEVLQQLDPSAVFDDPQPGRVRLDVRRINKLQLDQLGVAPEQVAIAPYCTYRDEDRFFSYRRTHEKNVQWSGIVAN